MVVDPNDLKPVAGENSDSPPKPTVQFLNTTSGLPGGDMHLSRSTTSSSPTYGPPHQVPLALPSSSNSASMSSSMHIITPPHDENNHHYVGLVNQAMTCYLNSLIQSLYMTPEFRNAIYNWEYKSGKGSSENSIPCQIQKLFLLLQTSDCNALETKDLTASFGWNSNEAYDQHDVQELCRLMFDALEVKWKNSPHDKLIQNLYQGSMQDFVKCLKCGKENVRKDFFLDLPLALKPFGAVESYKSIEEALSAFVDPELLSGCNQYHCENCNSKQDAHKGLRVTNFPYLLTIQLKRFDFDYNTMHRIKLNDKMTFPDILDLNAYVYDPENPNIQTQPLVDPEMVTVGEHIDPEYVNDLLDTKGRFVYELFSVMVHQGSAAGGHYYAYIKNMDQGKWYLFNDSRVEATSPSEIQRSFGGAYGGWSGSNTNAYMLMYRQIDRLKNSAFIRTDELPKHISTLRETWRQQEEAKEKEKQYRLSLVKVSIRLNILSDVEIPIMEMDLHTPRTKSISTIFSDAFQFFYTQCTSVNVSITKGNARLITFDKKNMTTVYVSKNDMDKTIESVIYPSYHHSTYDLYYLLDVKLPGRNYFDVKPGRTISIQRVDIVNRVVRPPYLLCMPSTATHVIQLKELIGKLYGDSQREYVTYRLVMEKGDNTMNKMSFMDVPNSTIENEFRDCYTATPNVYFDGGNAEDPELIADRQKQNLQSSLMLQILARKKFAFLLKIQLPSEEEVSRVASACSAFIGPCWSESMSNLECTDMNTAMEVLSEMPRSIDSQRPTSPSSEISDGGSMIISTGSVCQNTPQTSPNVSDGGDADEGIGSDDVMTTCEANIIIRDHDVFSDVSMSLETDSGSGSTMVPSSSNFDREIIITEELPHNIYTIDVDSRLTVGELKSWITSKIKTDSAQFVITKHTQEFDILDKGFESGAPDEESLSSAYTGASWISIKLRPPLKEDEKLIKIILLNTEEPIKENWKNLFDIPASKQVFIGDILLRCQRLYHELYGIHLELNRMRLRDLIMTSRTVLYPNRRLDTRNTWNNAIYLQILTDEKVIGMKGEPLLVRRFRPSTVEVGPIHEVMVPTDMANHIYAIRYAISKYTGIPVERIEITEPATATWETAKWPFLKPRLELLDGAGVFVTEQTSKTNVDSLEKIGIRVIYYRDTAEPRKEITEEERKQITIKDNTSSTNATICRRKERPLRIQLSSVSEA
ncbi:unnamed protein product [Auanema sp. JU1783]|nr:unnamed protein product [Auanema sp. JU1783]